MDRISKALALFASVLLAIVLLGQPGLAVAQDANDEDVSAPPKVPNISGCWQGNAFNDSQGNTSILFFFKQTGGNVINKKHSTVNVEGNVSIHGPISGIVKATKFRFSGPVAGTGFNPCTIKGKGFFQMDGSISGNYHYAGNCFENQFTGGDFSKVEFLGATCP